MNIQETELGQKITHRNEGPFRISHIDSPGEKVKYVQKESYERGDLSKPSQWHPVKEVEKVEK